MDKRIYLVAGGLLVAAATAAESTPPCGPENPVDQCFDQKTPGVESFADTDERFGATLAFGDFDNDGFDDLAVGAPGDDGAADDAGFVHVFYGSAEGLVLGSGTDQFDRGDLPGPNAAAGDEFGAALATGDFDGDGFDDLAIGSPFDDHPGCGLSGCEDGGSFQVVYGGDQGLELATAVTFEDLGISGFEAGDGTRLGETLGAGQIDGDGISDLLVCATGFGEVDEVPQRAGRCFRVFGAAGGLDQGEAAQVIATGTSTFHFFGEDLEVWDSNNNGFGQAAVGHPRFSLGAACPDCGAVIFNDTLRLRSSDLPDGSDTAGERFGAALAVGRFDGDTFEDLAIGVPGHSIPSPVGVLAGAGELYVVFGASGSLDVSALETQRVDQSVVGEVPASFEFTGSALAGGDFDGDGIDDLAIGAPGETSDHGQVMVVFGSAELGTLELGRNLELAQPALGGGVPIQDAALGSSLATGDVNGDGRAELAMGAPNHDIALPASGDSIAFGAGRVYVHSFPAGAQISAIKSVSGFPFHPGGLVTYTITIENTGVADQPDVRQSNEFFDLVPDQLAVISVSATSGRATATDNQVAWNGAVPVESATTITIHATLNVGTAGETVSNQGTVHVDSNADGSNETTLLTDDPDTLGAAPDATAFEVFCGAAADGLVFNVNIIDGTAVHEACSSITAGTLFEVGPEDDVTFRAGDRVVLGDGFSVLAGGSFTAVIADP